MSTCVWQRLMLAVLSLGLASLPVQAQTVGPLANTTVGNARLVVPDGSSLRQSIGTGETRWFVFGAEPGKTYVVEAVDPDSDLVSNTIGALHVYAADGTTTPPAETNVDCTASTRAPALEVPVAVDGMRCVVRAFPPSPGNTQNKRGLYVAVGLVAGPSFDIRVRESTIYGRWTTNGYDFHVELENTTADAMCAEVIFLPNTGDSYAGTWSGGLTTLQLTIPPFGANKTVFANGTLVGPDTRGTLRIGACPSLVNFVPSSLHVSTYAYNPVTDKFLYFFTNPANNGAASNSWSAASGAGTVTSIATGPGLSGGPITTAGTINLAATNLLPTVACAANQVPQWSGSAWACATAGGTGTVTSVGTGTGLTGGPITGSGTINLAGTQLLPTVACVSNQIPKWNGSAWACAADNTGPLNAFVQGGNAFGATAVLGTTDNNPLQVIVDNQVAMTLQPAVDPTYGYNPNLIAGQSGNSVAGGIAGATIAGGGGCNPGTGGVCNFANANQVTGSFGTVGGGFFNKAGGYGTVAGGVDNFATGPNSTIAGGVGNTASGKSSFATGAGANATHDNSFVWDGWSFGVAPSFSPNAAWFGGEHGLGIDYYAQRVDNGGQRWVYIGDNFSGITINTWTMAYLSDVGVWTNASDVNRKTGFESISPAQVLARVASMPITSWRYIGEDASKRHIGPMAQDFWAAFGLGDDDKHIGTIDESGVALAAIKGLNARVEEQQREIADLRERVSAAESLRGELAGLRAELSELREARTQITAHVPAAADGVRADATR